MTVQYVQKRIQSVYSALTRSEKKVADYITKYPEKVINMKVAQLADITDTSPASVIRFCKSIGIPSFTELKLSLSAETQIALSPQYSDISPEETLSDVKEKLLGNSYQAMLETMHLIDDQVIDLSVDLMKEAPVIYVFGVGSSYLVAENIAQKWNRIGKVCLCFSDMHILISSLASADKRSIFLGISHSGETKEVLSIIDIAHDLGIKTIAMTQFGVNSLSQAADFIIHTVASQEGLLRSAATSSLIAQFIAVDVLFYAYILDNYDEYMDHIIYSRKLVDTYKQE